MLIIWTGLMAGFLHVLSGPDHLAAIAPLSATNHRSAWKVGLRWGVGHSAGVVLVGALIYLLKSLLHIERFSAFNERLVGVALILIGFWGLYRAFSHKIHVHAHKHGGSEHVHVHSHEQFHPGVKHPSKAEHFHLRAALGVGILHGLAGSSHLLGVLPALVLPTAALTASYLMAFAAGTISAMVLFATTIGWMSRWNLFRTDFAYKVFLGALSSVAIGIGVYWLT
jgi:ABC-type nickel/cobalt efflux system permease component RcnA